MSRQRTVAVIGSGGAGLVAALAAAKNGAAVTVYEKHELCGGTTALSGGNAWLPANQYLDDDSPEAGLDYLRALGLGDSDDELLSVFVQSAREVAEWLEAETPLTFVPIPYTDYHAEFPGGRTQGGRTLEPQGLVPTPRAAALLRDAPNVTAPIVYSELAGGAIDREALAQRVRDGVVTLGRGLIAGLLEACLEAGVVIKTGVRVMELPSADSVIIATGGFERDPQLVKAFLRGPVHAPVGAPTAEGDGLRMAMAAGAMLGNMSEAWWVPALSVPGETIDGAPMHRLMIGERARPGSIIVDRTGRRFADEAQNYNDFGRTFSNFEPTSYSFNHVPAYLVFDNAYRTGYRTGPMGRRDPDPGWLHRGETLGGLAASIGVPAGALEATVSRFNEYAARDEDPDFGRGSLPYDRFIGKLGPLGQGPYFALELSPGCLGTKGGPRTDSDGRVLAAVTGEPIPGLFAVGNAAASPFGMAYPGAGGTLGQAFVFGMRAGIAAAKG